MEPITIRVPGALARAVNERMEDAPQSPDAHRRDLYAAWAAAPERRAGRGTIRVLTLTPELAPFFAALVDNILYFETADGTEDPDRTAARAAAATLARLNALGIEPAPVGTRYAGDDTPDARAWAARHNAAQEAQHAADIERLATQEAQAAARRDDAQATTDAITATLTAAALPMPLVTSSRPDTNGLRILPGARTRDGHRNASVYPVRGVDTHLNPDTTAAAVAAAAAALTADGWTVRRDDSNPNRPRLTATRPN